MSTAIGSSPRPVALSAGDIIVAKFGWHDPAYAGTFVALVSITAEELAYYAEQFTDRPHDETNSQAGFCPTVLHHLVHTLGYLRAVSPVHVVLNDDGTTDAAFIEARETIAIDMVGHETPDVPEPVSATPAKNNTLTLKKPGGSASPKDFEPGDPIFATSDRPPNKITETVETESSSAAPKESVSIPPTHTPMNDNTASQATSTPATVATPASEDRVYPLEGVLSNISRGMTSPKAPLTPKPYFKADFATTVRGKPVVRSLMGFGAAYTAIEPMLVEGGKATLRCKFGRAPNGGETLTAVAVATKAEPRAAAKASNSDQPKMAA